MFNKLGFVAAIFLMAATAMAQDCNLVLKGTVKDFHDNEPLPFAQIFITQLQKTISTDANGAYRVDDLCPGVYNFVITHYDCDTKKLSLTIKESKTRDFVLEHHVNDLQEVQVIADVHDDHKLSQSTTRINKSTIAQYAGASLGDALATVQGVSSLKTGNSVVKPVIHGVYGSRVTIVNNGLRQQDQEWGVEHAPNIDLNSAGSIQVIKGASALRYGGDAIGGTIIIEPERVIAKDTLKGTLVAQLQSNGQGGTLTSSVNNYNDSGWYQQATLTYKRLGDFEAPDYILSNTGSRTYAANVAAGFRTFEYGASINYSFYDSELGILRASHIGNVADLVRSINSGVPAVINDFTYDVSPPKQSVQHHGLQINAFKRFSDLGKLSLDYSLQFNNRLEFDVRIGQNEGRASLDLDLITHNIATHLLIDRSDNTEWQVGIDAMRQVNEPNPATGIRRLIPDYNSGKYGAFVSVNHTPGDNWLLDAGVRYDFYEIDAQKFYLRSRWESLKYDQQFPQFEVQNSGNQILTNPQLDYHLFAFTAGAKYFIGDHYDFSFNVSSASRAPNPSELFSDGLHHALATIELGQLDLKKEQSYKANLVIHGVEGPLDFEINPYASLINDYMQLVPAGLEATIRGAFPVYQYEQLDALIAGVDVSAAWTIFNYPGRVNNTDVARISGNKSLKLTSRFSYIYGQDRTADEPLIDMPPTQFFNELLWNNGIIDRLSLSIANESVLKQNRFPDNDYDATIPDDQGGFTTTRVNISESPAAFSLWNVGVSYAFAKAQLNLRVNNILNTRYRNYLNRQRFYADDIGRDVQIQFIYNF